MTTKPATVLLTILGKEYKIACEPAEQENLVRSAGELDAQMRKMRDSGKVGNAERIAVMAALNLSHELHSLRNQTTTLTPGWKECLVSMMSKIENALEKR
ncbi:MAG: cell division protein ZapA [Methylococcaceae bacterium]|jgi:cell division protein ZapA|nr:cell division protein ZapA [Methylococcaceae bacterium]